MFIASNSLTYRAKLDLQESMVYIYSVPSEIPGNVRLLVLNFAVKMSHCPLCANNVNARPAEWIRFTLLDSYAHK